MDSDDPERQVDGEEEPGAPRDTEEPEPAEAGRQLGVPQYVTHIGSAQGTINIGPSLSVGRAGAPLTDPEWTDTGYNIGAIRRLLLAAFTPEELRRFCQDEADFRPLVAYFGPGQGLVDMVDRVVDYCQTRLLWDELLAAVERTNPAQYRRFSAEIGRPAETEPPADPKAERLAALRQRVRTFAPAAQRPEALSRVDALGQALAGPQPDLSVLESTWRWFGAELPPLAGPVLSVILAAGREIQEGDDDELWADFQERFGEL